MGWILDMMLSLFPIAMLAHIGEGIAGNGCEGVDIPSTGLPCAGEKAAGCPLGGSSCCGTLGCQVAETLSCKVAEALAQTATAARKSCVAERRLAIASEAPPCSVKMDSICFTAPPLAHCCEKPCACSFETS
eukprot:5537117-Amphidinium_carterae.2